MCMLMFYSPEHFISSPYLFFPVSQTNVGEIKRILKHCEVSTIIFLWPSLGSLFLLVCSAVGIGNEKKKPFLNVIFELLFPPLLPGASLYFALSVLSHSAWISCHSSWASTSAPRLPSDSSRFASDPQKWGKISAPELWAWYDLGILMSAHILLM